MTMAMKRQTPSTMSLKVVTAIPSVLVFLLLVLVHVEVFLSLWTLLSQHDSAPANRGVTLAEHASYVPALVTGYSEAGDYLIVTMQLDLIGVECDPSHLGTSGFHSRRSKLDSRKASLTEGDFEHIVLKGHPPYLWQDLSFIGQYCFSA